MCLFMHYEANCVILGTCEDMESGLPVHGHGQPAVERSFLYMCSHLLWWSKGNGCTELVKRLDPFQFQVGGMSLGVSRGTHFMIFHKV